VVVLTRRGSWHGLGWRLRGGSLSGQTLGLRGTVLDRNDVNEPWLFASASSPHFEVSRENPEFHIRVGRQGPVRTRITKGDHVPVSAGRGGGVASFVRGTGGSEACGPMLAFVPIPSWVPSWVVRLVWLGSVIVVPLAMGITMAAKAPAHAKHISVFQRLLSGFPITIGLALAFLIMFVTVPVMRLWSLLRGHSSADIPLITESRAYHQVTALAITVLKQTD
jgi:hypothetical protein